MKYLKYIIFTLVTSLIVLASPINAAAETPSGTQIEEDFSGFENCSASGSASPAQKTSLGADLGDGISEIVTDELRAVVNQGLSSVGKAPLKPETAALRYLANGKILAVDSSGHELAELSGADTPNPESATSSPSAIAQPESVWSEVKRIIGACLGFGGAGVMGFEQLVRWLGNPRNAIKFVIRRLGLFGAISCIGGIIWEYI